MPKVSVIIPIYNVGSFLRPCIESVTGQTLRDIEIILVDDGSTDGSAEQCDEYAAADGRVRVIHRPNGGLSRARNDGIDLSSAPYIMFVDGDDYVEPGFCEKPYDAALAADADLVIFNAYSVKNGRVKIRGGDMPDGVVDVETALKYGASNAWNKLYKRELFDVFRFPEGRVYEDIAVTHKIIFSAEKIVMLPDALYYYVYREGSISNTHTVENEREGFISWLQRSEDLQAYGCPEELYLDLTRIRALRYMIRANPCDDPVFLQAEQVLDSIGEIPAKWKLKRKLLLLLWKTDKRLFHFVCRTTGRKST